MREQWPKAVAIGLVAGFLSGLLGIGGGVVIVPALILILNVDQFRASATSVATISVTASAGLLTFGIGGSVDWAVAGLVLIGSTVGAWFGAKYLELVPEWALAGVFTMVITVAAVRMWL